MDWAVLGLPREAGRRDGVEGFFESGEEVLRSIEADVGKIGLSLRGGRALDFGCGPGRFTRALARRYAAVVGVDVSEGMVALARSLNAREERLSFEWNESSDLAPLGSRRFDLVFSAYVLQHLPDWLATRYLREFSRVLVPNGILVVQDHGHPVRRWMRKIPPRWIHGPLNWSRRRGAARGSAPLEARWDDYWIPPGAMHRILESAGLQLRSTAPDPKPDGRLVSYWYVAQKPAGEASLERDPGPPRGAGSGPSGSGGR